MSTLREDIRNQFSTAIIDDYPQITPIAETKNSGGRSSRQEQHKKLESGLLPLLPAPAACLYCLCNRRNLWIVSPSKELELWERVATEECSGYRIRQLLELKREQWIARAEC